MLTVGAEQTVGKLLLSEHIYLIAANVTKFLVKKSHCIFLL